MSTKTVENSKAFFDTQKLEIFASNIRIKAIEMIGGIGKGHIGGSMSIVEALAVLYGGAMRINPQNPNWNNRDRLVLSKGHAGPALYAALAIKGFFPEEWLTTMNHIGTKLPSHANAQLTPGVDISTGSLGQGLSVAIGLAIADKLDNCDSYVFCIMGDGECQEGQVWEAAMFAGNHKLNRLVVMVDNNKRQCGNLVCKVNDIKDISNKFMDFGFGTIKVNGHDVRQIKMAINKAKNQKSQPFAIILDTVKGKGCSFAEQIEDNHNISVSNEQVNEAVSCIQKQINENKAKYGEEIEY